MTRYQNRISGPMLDRIDIHIEVPRVDFEKLSDNRRGEGSEEIRAQIEEAGELQRERFAGQDCTSFKIETSGIYFDREKEFLNKRE